MTARNRRRRRKLKKRMGALRQQTRALIVQRMNSEDAPIFDHAFTRLHEELAQWPDGWHVDPHGTGGNPHIWLPAKRNSMLVYDDRMCPCGLYKTDFDNATFIQGEVQYLLNGLMNRDVQ